MYYVYSLLSTYIHGYGNEIENVLQFTLGVFSAMKMLAHQSNIELLELTQIPAVEKSS